jgi:hypothetical protein
VRPIVLVLGRVVSRGHHAAVARGVLYGHRAAVVNEQLAGLKKKNDMIKIKKTHMKWGRDAWRAACLHCPMHIKRCKTTYQILQSVTERACST